MSNLHQRGGFLPARVVHLHASRRCNLSCQHCYSMSGPHERAELAPALIIPALELLRGEGYDVLSLSGGEPLLYSGFAPVVAAATALGFTVNMISNGAALGERNIEVIARHVSLVAISLDGAPELHVELRGNSQAFAHAQRALERLAAARLRYGVAYCVSRESLAAMPWAVEFARAQGAALVQFHPFAATGRGRALAERLALSPAQRARAYLVATLLDTGAPAVGIDLAHSAAALEQRAAYTALRLADARATPLAELANPLVIDEQGRVLPLSFGIGPQFALGRLDDDFAATVAQYKAAGWLRLRHLIETAFARLEAADAGFIDWFHHLVETSLTMPRPEYAAAARLAPARLLPVWPAPPPPL